jgi:hypothetical protein
MTEKNFTLDARIEYINIKNPPMLKYTCRFYFLLQAKEKRAKTPFFLLLFLRRLISGRSSNRIQ